jgi:hypothetical protein
MEHSSRNTDRHMFRESGGNTRQLHADTGTLTEYFKEMEHSSRNTDRHMFRENRGNTRQLHADTGTLNR